MKIEKKRWGENFWGTKNKTWWKIDYGRIKGKGKIKNMKRGPMNYSMYQSYEWQK